jgi:hypothetical protein
MQHEEDVENQRKANSKLEALRAALSEGENSDPSEPFDLEQFLEQMRHSRRAV